MILVEFLAVWVAISVALLLLLALLTTIERLTGRCLAELAADFLGRDRDDRDCARMIAVAEERERLLAEHALSEPRLTPMVAQMLADVEGFLGLEAEWVLADAPNPKLIFVSGSLERRLDEQRRREAGR